MSIMMEGPCEAELGSSSEGGGSSWSGTWFYAKDKNAPWFPFRYSRVGDKVPRDLVDYVSFISSGQDSSRSSKSSKNRSKSKSGGLTNANRSKALLNKKKAQNLTGTKLSSTAGAVGGGGKEPEGASAAPIGTEMEVDGDGGVVNVNAEGEVREEKEGKSTINKENGGVVEKPTSTSSVEDAMLDSMAQEAAELYAMSNSSSRAAGTGTGSISSSNSNSPKNKVNMLPPVRIPSTHPLFGLWTGSFDIFNAPDTGLPVQTAPGANSNTNGNAYAEARDGKPIAGKDGRYIKQGPPKNAPACAPNVNTNSTNSNNSNNSNNAAVVAVADTNTIDGATTDPAASSALGLSLVDPQSSIRETFFLHSFLGVKSVPELDCLPNESRYTYSAFKASPQSLLPPALLVAEKERTGFGSPARQQTHSHSHNYSHKGAMPLTQTHHVSGIASSSSGKQMAPGPNSVPPQALFANAVSAGAGTGPGAIGVKMDVVGASASVKIETETATGSSADLKMKTDVQSETETVGRVAVKEEAATAAPHEEDKENTGTEAATKELELEGGGGQKEETKEDQGEQKEEKEKKEKKDANALKLATDGSGPCPLIVMVGFGRNTYGRFSLTATYNRDTRRLVAEKRYMQSKSSTQQRKSRARTEPLPEPDMINPMTTRPRILGQFAHVYDDMPAVPKRKRANTLLHGSVRGREFDMNGDEFGGDYTMGGLSVGGSRKHRALTLGDDVYGMAAALDPSHIVGGPDPGDELEYKSAYYDEFTGEVYEGGWVGNRRQGRGICLYADGSMYEGQWNKNKEHGRGQLMTSDRKILYAGEWMDGHIHGHGTYNFYSGDCYTGDWREGNRHGKGEFISKDGCKYNGDWRDNKRSGRGVFSWPDGSLYEGEWEDDCRHGKGILALINGVQYEGLWAYNFFEGRGVTVFPNGQRYEGSYKAGLREGRGSVKFQEGAVYEGRFRDDRLDGQGTIKVTRVVPGAEKGERLFPIEIQADIRRVHLKAGFGQDDH